LQVNIWNHKTSGTIGSDNDDDLGLMLFNATFNNNSVALWQ
jgi:hypothetical protein